MDGLKDYQISVYVANLGKYVEGVLQGAWITLPMPAERLQDTLKTEVGLGGRYEEYAIHDYEGGEGLLATVANPGEYESLTDLNLMCRAFEAREDDDPDVYEKVQAVRDDLDAAPRTPLQYANLALNSDEIPYHSYDAPLWADSKEAKYAWTAVNQGWASDAVWSMFDTGLGYLIDMEMYGRDLKLDGDVSLGDNGYLEDADWPSDIDGRESRQARHAIHPAQERARSRAGERDSGLFRRCQGIGVRRPHGVFRRGRRLRHRSERGRVVRGVLAPDSQ